MKRSAAEMHNRPKFIYHFSKKKNAFARRVLWSFANHGYCVTTSAEGIFARHRIWKLIDFIENLKQSIGFFVQWVMVQLGFKYNKININRI